MINSAMFRAIGALLAITILVGMQFLYAIPPTPPPPQGCIDCTSVGGPGGGGSGGGSSLNALEAPLVNICVTVRNIIGVLALVLFIIGGTMYAIAHLLPAAGNIRGNVQGWSLGMIMGSIVGLVLILLAPQLISLIVSASGTTISTPTLAGC